MIENKEQINSIEEQKRKIRKRYKGTSLDELLVIPAAPEINFFEDQRERRVAVYARVSTDSLNQTSSYELQKNYYMDSVSRYPGWKLVDIYADEGISGTSLNHRLAFIRMIEDCKNGKIDLIVTKNVSRFARNVLDCVGQVRELAAMNPPIEVYFETEGIHTLNKDSEMQLAFLSTMAQEESHNKSEIMNSSIEMRFSRGIFLTPTLLGYDHDENGELIINESEAETVKLIFFMYLFGNNCTQIAETLTSLKRTTKKGNTNWSPSSILQILQNERHCGDIIAHKTWTPNYLDHKSKKNHRDKAQYVSQGHHEPIISRDDFNAVQKIIQNSKYCHHSFLPELQVITDGSLKGYISINPRWAGFKACDYYDAVENIIPTKEEESTSAIGQAGDFDLRGFEVAKSQFFTDKERITATFTNKTIAFNSPAVNKLAVIKVELLVNPTNQSFAVRIATPATKNAVVWAKKDGTKFTPKFVRGMAFLPTLFQLFQWKSEYKYRLTGVRHQNDDASVLIFNLNDMEVFIPTEMKSDTTSDSNSTNSKASKINIMAYPAEWARSFGNTYYKELYSHEATAFAKDKEWNINSLGESYQPEQDISFTPPHEVDKHISTIINTMKQEVEQRNE